MKIITFFCFLLFSFCGLPFSQGQTNPCVKKHFIIKKLANPVFSPLEKNKIWGNYYQEKPNKDPSEDYGTGKNVAYEIDVNTGAMLKLEDKFHFPNFNLLKPFFVDTLDQSFWALGDSTLLRYDLSDQTTQIFNIGDFTAYLSTAKSLFFVGQKGIFAYKRIEKRFVTLFPNPSFEVDGLRVNPNSGFIHVNPTTAINEANYSFQVCSDAFFKVYQSYSDAAMEKQKKYTTFGIDLNPFFVRDGMNSFKDRSIQFSFEDETGYWVGIRDFILFQEKKEPNRAFYLPITTYHLLYDATNFYTMQHDTLTALPKCFLRTQMKVYNPKQMKEEKDNWYKLTNQLNWGLEISITNSMLQDSATLYAACSKSDQPVEKVFKNYEQAKKYCATASNPTLLSDWEGIKPTAFLNWNLNYYPVLKASIKKALEKGTFPLTFKPNLHLVFIDELLEKGNIEGAYRRFNAFFKKYTNAKKEKTTDEYYLIIQQSATHFENIKKKVKAPDSLLWYEIQTLDQLDSAMSEPIMRSINIRGIKNKRLIQLKERYPKSYFVQEADFKLLVNSFGNHHYYMDLPLDSTKVTEYYAFLEKYPNSPHKIEVLEEIAQMYFQADPEILEEERTYARKALSICEELEKIDRNHYFADGQDLKTRIEEKIEAQNWEYQITLPKTQFERHEVIPYTIRLKNTGKLPKTLQTIDCDHQIQLMIDLYPVEEPTRQPYNFCENLTPPKCPEETITLAPNEEKMITGVLDNVFLDGEHRGMVKFLETGMYRIGVRLPIFIRQERTLILKEDSSFTFEVK